MTDNQHLELLRALEQARVQIEDVSAFRRAEAYRLGSEIQNRERVIRDQRRVIADQQRYIESLQDQLRPHIVNALPDPEQEALL